MKTKDRVKQTAEVFTPPALVDEMLNKLPKEMWEDGKTFLDNSCGDGNFLVHVLTRKLQKGHDPISALKTIYGTDIMHDNIIGCRLRLLDILKESGVEITEDICRVVVRNIRWLDAKRYPQGSLNYNFAFTGEIKRRRVVTLLEQFNSRKADTHDRTHPPVHQAVYQPSCVA
jgi:hypothetical protein